MFAATKLTSVSALDYKSKVNLGRTGIKQIYTEGAGLLCANYTGVHSYSTSSAYYNGDIEGYTYIESFSLLNCSGAYQRYNYSTSTIYLYTLDTTSNKVKEFSYSAFFGSMATATATGKEFSVASQTTSGFNLMFYNGGTIMVIQSSSNIYKYTLSTAWDITTASLSTTTSHSGTSIFDATYGMFLYSADAGEIKTYSPSSYYTFDFSSGYTSTPARELNGGTSSVMAYTGGTYNIAGNSDGVLYAYKLL